MYETDDEVYECEEDYLDSLKRNDSYYFPIDFEYIEKRHGDGDYDMATATMDVEVEWNDFEHGYVISYSCPDEYLIDPNEGNGNLSEFYDVAVYFEVMDRLADEGIGAEAVVGGGL